MKQSYWTEKDIPNIANIDLAIGVMERVIAEDLEFNMQHFDTCLYGHCKRWPFNFSPTSFNLPGVLRRDLTCGSHRTNALYGNINIREITPHMVIEKLQAIKSFGEFVQESLKD